MVCYFFNIFRDETEMCGGGPDIMALHLIAVYDSGAARVFTLKLDAKGMWKVHSQTKNPFKTSVSHPVASFVIGPDGADTKPTPEALAILPTEDPKATSPRASGSSDLRSLWILASSKECRCFVDVTGERVARIDWASPVKRVEMVSKTGGLFPCHLCVVGSDCGDARYAARSTRHCCVHGESRGFGVFGALAGAWSYVPSPRGPFTVGNHPESVICYMELTEN